MQRTTDGRGGPNRPFSENQAGRGLQWSYGSGTSATLIEHASGLRQFHVNTETFAFGITLAHINIIFVAAAQISTGEQRRLSVVRQSAGEDFLSHLGRQRSQEGPPLRLRRLLDHSREGAARFLTPLGFHAIMEEADFNSCRCFLILGGEPFLFLGLLGHIRFVLAGLRPFPTRLSYTEHGRSRWRSGR